MARIEVCSVQTDVPSVWVEVDEVSDQELSKIYETLATLLEAEAQVSDAVAKAFQFATELCPDANPSDVWHHVIYRRLLSLKFNDARWKRISGFALERAFQNIYEDRLAENGLRMRIVDGGETQRLLEKLGLRGQVRDSKIDMFIERNVSGTWVVVGGAHVKASLAERIQDDVPASRALMSAGLISIVITLDVKSFPPPHGNGVNYGELGGRTQSTKSERLKRAYVEIDGQFDAMFSYNLRTPPSPGTTPSGKKIFTLALYDEHPDALVAFLAREVKTRFG